MEQKIKESQPKQVIAPKTVEKQEVLQEVKGHQEIRIPQSSDYPGIAYQAAIIDSNGNVV